MPMEAAIWMQRWRVSTGKKTRYGEVLRFLLIQKLFSCFVFHAGTVRLGREVEFVYGGLGAPCPEAVIIWTLRIDRTY